MRTCTMVPEGEVCGKPGVAKYVCVSLKFPLVVRCADHDEGTRLRFLAAGSSLKSRIAIGWGWGGGRPGKVR